ncbi:MAG TPA: hypothetical protein DDW76_13220 [Cyanobacteria bacterium UBA11369]|nr:hypothetical protein [Cyanobacteria bacterium UBA11371]HBE21607.1 hypothetical protein [Cyanobacteria bacterium UBA11367]HBE30039.1 hypothetical protein [Cyanobacteria bacterium UBA11368]HBE49718.1 hypothetical protein [Cyanobacteria bacterium UBA11369]
MVSTPEPRSQSVLDSRSLNIRESKIIHRSAIVHHLARFVTEETVALLFKIAPEQIERIECWQYVVYVHGVGVSCFVSYADFPPILAVDAPTAKDFVRWRKRWRSKFAPQFWQEFYTHQFECAFSIAKLFEWGQLVGLVKSALSEAVLQKLRTVFASEKMCLEF